MKISQDILKQFGYTPVCAKCRKLSRNEQSHPGLAHSQDCRTRIEAASRTDPVYRDRSEGAEHRKMDFYAKEVERIDHPRRLSFELSVVPEPSIEEREGEDHSSSRDVKRARGEPEQDLSVEIPIPSADETLTTPGIPAAPSGVIPPSSTSTPISLGASSSSGVKRTYSESSALQNSPGVSSGSGVKRAHGESIVTDDEEQPGTRAWISALIAGLHGVDAAEDDETCSGDGKNGEWLSSWFPETHMSQKMVIEAKRKEIERFERMKVYRVVTRESMKRDEEGKMISIMWVITNKGTGTSNCQGTSGGTSCLQEHQV